MRVYQKRMVEENVVSEVTCDGCGRREINQTHQRRWEPDGWHSFYSGHSDWGNDSVDSSERHDVCSGECYLKLVREVFEDYGNDRNRPTLRVDSMDYEFIRSLLRASSPGPGSRDA